MEDKTGPGAGKEGIVENVKGKVKEVSAQIAGNERMERESKAQQRKAQAKRNAATPEAKAEKARGKARG
jgi:uncharacterized protein YjbJ (UPF0337 family)